MDIPSKVTKTTDTSVVVELSIDDKAITKLLELAGHIIPKNAYIYIEVPGGGDWSNTDLKICKHYPVRVRWVTVERKIE